MKKILSFLLVLCLSVSVPVLAFQEKSADIISIFSDYTGLNLEQYRGKAIFLNVFTEWCPYCMQEMPDLRSCYEAYPDVQFILVHPWDGEDATNTANVCAAYSLDGMTFYEDQNSEVITLLYQLGLTGYPHSMVLDAQGSLVYSQSGMLELTTMQKILDAAVQ